MGSPEGTAPAEAVAAPGAECAEAAASATALRPGDGKEA